MSVLVVGSFITDLVVRTNKSPTKGETVIGNSFNVFLGGKGANQAVSSIRQGSKTYMLGALGKDDFGKNFKEFMEKEGFNSKHILTKNTTSGIGHVTVNEKTGQNQITIVPAANFEYKVSDLLKYEHLFKEATIAINQLEMCDEIILKTKELAKKYNKIYLLNPAPFKKLSDDFLNGIDILTPNETELQGIVQDFSLKTVDDYAEAAKKLLDKGVKNVIVTLGCNGSLLVNKEKVKHFAPFKLKKAVDSTGAGDSFNGALAAMIDQGHSLDEAIEIANAAGALSVTKKGAIPSIPTKEEVIDFINKF